jgi:hypothetical protein
VVDQAVVNRPQRTWHEPRLAMGKVVRQGK